MLETFTCSTFAAVVGTTFRLHAGGAPIDLALIGANELPARPGGPGRAPFSLVFLGPPGVVVPQGTYGVEHASVEAFELFVVPIGAGADGVRYEAIFA